MNGAIMKKTDFKKSLLSLLKNEIEDLSYEQKMDFVNKTIVEFEIDSEDLRDTSNKGNPWKDDELRLILLDAPTRENCMKYAKFFKRGYGSIAQIYQWAATTDKEINKKRKDDKFIKQVRKVAKEVGFIA